MSNKIMYKYLKVGWVIWNDDYSQSTPFSYDVFKDYYKFDSNLNLWVFEFNDGITFLQYIDLNNKAMETERCECIYWNERKEVVLRANNFKRENKTPQVIKKSFRWLNLFKTKKN